MGKSVSTGSCFGRWVGKWDEGYLLGNDVIGESLGIMGEVEGEWIGNAVVGYNEVGSDVGKAEVG